MIDVFRVIRVVNVTERSVRVAGLIKLHFEYTVSENYAHKGVAKLVNRRADSTRNKQNTIARIACIFKERSTAKRDKKAENDYHSNRTRKLKKQMSEYLHKSSLSKMSYLLSSLESCLRYAFINPSISPSITESILPSS